MHAPFPLVTRRTPAAGPRRDAWDLTDAWFERPRLTPVAATIDRSPPPRKQDARGLRFAVVSLGLVVASIAATAFVVAPHAKEITSVPAARARPIQLAPIVEAAISEGEAYAATPEVTPPPAAPQAVAEGPSSDPLATPTAGEPLEPKATPAPRARHTPSRKVPDVHFR